MEIKKRATCILTRPEVQAIFKTKSCGETRSSAAFTERAFLSSRMNKAFRLCNLPPQEFRQQSSGFQRNGYSRHWAGRTA